MIADDEPRKIQVHIRPVAKDNTSHPVSNEEFKKITLNLSSPSSKVSSNLKKTAKSLFHMISLKVCWYWYNLRTVRQY